MKTNMKTNIAAIVNKDYCNELAQVKKCPRSYKTLQLSCYATKAFQHLYLFSSIRGSFSSACL